MTTYRIETRKYDIDLSALLTRRLTQCACAHGLMADSADGGAAVTVSVSDSDGKARLAEALSLLVCRDLRYFELARLVDELPLSLTERQAVLTEALALGCPQEELENAARDLAAYLAAENTVNLEGFLTFRLRSLSACWQRMAERVAEERLLRQEYGRLMDALSAFVHTQKPLAGELSICLNPDGSCTLTDDSDARIEYVDCSEDGVLSLLVGMAPAFLTVYDLSGGAGARLTDALRRVFAGRVRIYR